MIEIRRRTFGERSRVRLLVDAPGAGVKAHRWTFCFQPSCPKQRAMISSKQIRALADFRYGLRKFLAFSEAATRASGVTPQQYQALLIIKTHPSGAVLVRDLAQELLLRHNSTVQLVDRLAEADLVRRVPATDDRRSVILRLTPRGEKKLAGLAESHFAALVSRRSDLGQIFRQVRSLKR
jgi:DNA-binding MarR family transcriptional regulator